MIKLPNGPYIRVNKIIQVNEPWNNGKNWHYCVDYFCDLDNTIKRHIVNLSSIIDNESRALEWVVQFVNKINESN